MLSAAKQDVLLNGQTAIARKVFEIVPIQEAWTAQQIQTAFTRTTRANIEFKTLHGCLRALVSTGLVNESRSGYYERSPTREKQTLRLADLGQLKLQQTEKTEEVTTMSQNVSAVDMLRDLGKTARAFAESASVFAADIEACAALVAEETAANAEGARQFREFQTLLNVIANKGSK
jgi:small-conductance mechanosensitive channel